MSPLFITLIRLKQANALLGLKGASIDEATQIAKRGLDETSPFQVGGVEKRGAYIRALKSLEVAQASSELTNRNEFKFLEDNDIL